MKYLPHILLVVLCLCALILQPITLVGAEETRIVVHVGKTVPLEALVETAGGYKCYVSETEYFWLSDAESSVEYSDQLAVRFKLWRPATIYRRNV